MSVMLEVYYARPQDANREAELTGRVVLLGGRFDFREENEIREACDYVCLTYKFDTWPQAERAAAVLRGHGEHIEGPSEYGD